MRCTAEREVNRNGHDVMIACWGEADEDCKCGYCELCCERVCDRRPLNEDAGWAGPVTSNCGKCGD